LIQFSFERRHSTDAGAGRNNGELAAFHFDDVARVKCYVGASNASPTGLA
jgi:hypothetical protein